MAVAVRGRVTPEWLTDEDIPALLNITASANLSAELTSREITEALTFMRNNRERLETLAHTRAEALLADHRRVWEAARDLGSYTVKACLPVDVMGGLSCCLMCYDVHCGRRQNVRKPPLSPVEHPQEEIPCMKQP